MGIESVKRWQWALVAVAVGPLLAFMNGQVDPVSSVRSIAGEDLEREIVLHQVPGDLPNIRNVRVHPVTPPAENAYGKSCIAVTFDRAVFNARKGAWEYNKSSVVTDVPYVSGTGGRRSQRVAAAATSVDPNRTILTALKDIAAKNPRVTYKYAWWEEPKWSYSLWTGGALVAIGGVWPTVMALLVGAGLGPEKKEQEYDLDRFGKSEEAGSEASGAPKPERKEMSADDREKLNSQLDRLEKNIGSAAVMTDVPAPAVGASAGPAPIRQLNGGPVEAVAAAKEEEDKEYKGEFYPVAKVGAAKPAEPAGRGS